jgi:serine/threonine-protein kinase
MVVEPGKRFDRYAVEELVGEGGMGRVYRAFDTRLERCVALKVLHDAAGDGADSVAVALREARAAAAIAHPNATAIYDAHEVEGTSFIAMEFVDGTSLRTLVAGPPVPLSTRVRWLIDIAAALDAAHRTGVVHRDVKPENVMVRNDGLVKVLDFGVARRTVLDAEQASHPSMNGTEAADPAAAASPSRSGAQTRTTGTRVAGTPAYMAPEQVRGEAIDGRADQFGWGVLAYELLTRRLPWRTARDVLGYIAAVVSEEVVAPNEIEPEIPGPVAASVMRALSKHADDRFPSMLAAAAALVPFARASLSMSAVQFLEEMVPTSSGAPVASARSPFPERPQGTSPLAEPDDGEPVSPSHARVEIPSTPNRSAHDAHGRARRRWPYGSGLHEPDFDAPIDFEAHVALLPPGATCKGVFFSDVLRVASSVTREHEVFRAAFLQERRYLRFSDYPLAEVMRLAITTSHLLYPRQSVGEGLRRLGHSAFDAVMTTQIGRALFGILGTDVEPILLASPKAYKLMINVGTVSVEKTGPRSFAFRARDLPAFLETYQIGVLEGVLSHCRERAAFRIAIDDPANATLELELG